MFSLSTVNIAVIFSIVIVIIRVYGLFWTVGNGGSVATAVMTSVVVCCISKS